MFNLQSKERSREVSSFAMVKRDVSSFSMVAGDGESRIVDVYKIKRLYNLWLERMMWV